VSKIRLQGLQQVPEVEKITTGTDEDSISNSPDEVDSSYEQETVSPTPDGSAVPDDGGHEGGETGSDKTAPRNGYQASGVSTSDADPTAVYETSSITTERGKGAITKESNKTSSRIGNSLPIITSIFFNWM
jgi:hypothetical protein